MVPYQHVDLDTTFSALADSTRRGVLEHLGMQDASISDLAELFHMTLTGIRKHVGILEEAGLVITYKTGRVRVCKISGRKLETVDAWITAYHQLWVERFDALDQVIAGQKTEEKADGQRQPG